MKRIFLLWMMLFLSMNILGWAQEDPSFVETVEAQDDLIKRELDKFFDDQLLIERFAEKIQEETKDNLLSMIDDKNLYNYKIAAAVRVFREKYAKEVVQRERAYIEKVFLRRLEVSRSIFLEIEIMHTLLVIDRYRFFAEMVSMLIKGLDHYDLSAVDLAFKALNEVVIKDVARTREARIVFNVLRKIFFLSRKKLAAIEAQDVRLKYKLSLLRWAIKVLGTQELRNLPKEVISLM